MIRRVVPMISWVCATIDSRARSVLGEAAICSASFCDCLLSGPKRAAGYWQSWAELQVWRERIPSPQNVRGTGRRDTRTEKRVGIRGTFGLSFVYRYLTLSPYGDSPSAYRTLGATWQTIPAIADSPSPTSTSWRAAAGFR